MGDKMAAPQTNDDLIISISTDTTELVNAQKNAAKQVVGTLATIEKAAIQAGLKIDNAFIDAGKEIEKGIGEGSKKANVALKTLNTALSKQTQELAKVKALYPQAGKAVDTYEAAVNSLAKAFTAGDATAKQFQSGLERERQSLLINTAEMRKNQNAILARNKAAATPVPRMQQPANNNVAGEMTGASGFQTANIAAQFQDIAVTAAMGMSPMQIALQQGTQLSAILNTMGNGRQVVMGLASAFASVISPVSLVTIGLIAGGAALAQYLMSGKDKAKELEKVLKSHEQNITDIRQAWGDAAKGLDDYNKKTPLELRVQARTDQSDLTDALKSQAADMVSGATGVFQNAVVDIEDKIRSLSAALSTEQDQSKIQKYYEQLFKLNGALEEASKAAPVAGEKFTAFKSEIDAFGKTIQDGTPQVVAFATAIREKIDANPANQELVKLGRELLKLIADLETTGKSLGQNAASFGVMSKSVELSADQLKRINDELDRYKEAMTSVAAIKKIALPAQSDLEQIEERYNEAIVKARGNKNVEYAAIRERDAAIKRYRSQFIINADGDTTTVPVPGQRPNRESQEPDKAIKKQETAAEKAKKTYENLLTSVNNRNDLLRLEIDLQGRAAAATDSARAALETLQKAQKAGITGENLEQIKREVAVYQQLADTLAKTKLSQDLASQGWMSSLSKDDQRVAQMLKQYGLSTNLNSPEANQIRQFNSQQDQREEITSFLTGIKNGVVTGGRDIGQSLADSIRNALLNQANKIWDTLFQRVANAIVGGGSQPSTVASGALGLGASTVSRLTSSTAIANQAGPVTTPITNNMQAYAAAVRKIESGGNYSALGPVLKSGDRAHGAYQVMGANIPSWTKGATGTEMTAQQFLASRESQDAVFNKYFGASLKKYGNPQDAASVWFSGRPLSKAGNASDGFNTTPEYVTKFNAALGDASKNVGTFGNDITQIGKSVLGAGKEAIPAVATGVSNQPVDASAFSQITNGITQLMSSIGSGLGSLLSKILGGGGGGGLLGILGFAEGGQIGAKQARGRIQGPGGPKSDKVLLWGSNGEFMMNAEATRKNLPLLQAINAGSMLFRADGGMIGPRPVVAPVAPTLRPRISASNENNRNPGVLQVHINGASGDAHIRELVKEGVGSGLSTYNIQQARGGQGTLDAQYRSRKG